SGSRFCAANGNEESAMSVSEETYRRVSLEDPEGLWELVCGRLRSKPLMTTEHYDVAGILVHLLNAQLGLSDSSVRMEGPRLRISTRTYYLPDVCVVPRAYIRRLRETPGSFETYTDPMPLVVEVWSPSTGNYDVKDKLREYQGRGDLEIWRLHPYERTLTTWRRQTDGSYSEALLRVGTVRPVALPSVSIELAALFG
ncbi:MAG: Uma2 family endonuclease, partial [Dehalococcoidia bacterium]